MLFSEIGDIRAILCTIEACTDKRQVINHLRVIISLAELKIKALKESRK